MGNRLHVARKYVVEYGTYSNFNWQAVEFHDFLDSMEIEIGGTDRTTDTCPWDFEIAKEDWISGIERLKDFNNLSQARQAKIRQALKSVDTTRAEMIEIMETYLQEADPEWDYLEFAFF